MWVASSESGAFHKERIKNLLILIILIYDANTETQNMNSEVQVADVKRVAGRKQKKQKFLCIVKKTPKNMVFSFLQKIVLKKWKAKRK